MLATQLDAAASTDEQTRRQIIRELAAHPEEVLDGIIEAMKVAPKSRWVVALQVLREIGYPRNVLALPELIGHISNLNSPASREAMLALTEIEETVVIPYLIKALLDKSQIYWEETIAGVCSMLCSPEVKREYVVPCGPAVVYLLSQEDLLKSLDPWYLLIVLEKIGVECAFYSLPVLINLATRKVFDEVSQQAQDLLASFDKEFLETYKYIY